MARGSDDHAQRVIGRHHELAALTGVAVRAAQGSFGTVLLEGDAGVGKTHLVEQAIAGIDGSGTLTLRGCGRVLQGDRPFGLVGDALGLRHDAPDPRRVALGRLLWSDPADDGRPRLSATPELRYHLVEGAVELLRHLATSTPVLLVLEDLHWADDGSILVLEQLVRRLADQPLALIATFRPAPRPRALEHVLDADLGRSVTRLRMGGLDPPSVDELVARMLAARPGPELRRLCERAGGNPLYLTELVRALLAEDAIVVDDGVASLTTSTLPRSLRDVVARSLRFLSDDAHEVIMAASVLGSTFSVEDLAVVMDRSVSATLRALREPLRGRLLVEDRERLTFQHDLVHEILYDTLPAAGRDALHAQAARRLAAAGRPAGTVARHFLLGATEGDVEAVDWLTRAGRAAAGRAPGAAVELLEAATRIAGRDHPERDTIETDLAIATVWSGCAVDGEARLRSLLERSHDPEIELPVRLTLAQALFHDGRMHSAVEEVERALRLPAITTVQRAHLLAESALGAVWSGALDQARSRARDALRAGRTVGDDATICSALAVHSSLEQVGGRLRRALKLAGRAVEIAESSPGAETRRRPPHILLGLILAEHDQLEEAVKAIDTARRIAEELGTVWYLPMLHWVLGLSHFFAGDLDDAASEIDAGVEMSEEIGTRLQLIWARAVQAHVHLLRDRLDAARDAIGMGEQEMTRTGPQAKSDWLLWARAGLAEAEGDVETAHTVLRLVWDAYDQIGVVSERRAVGPDLVRLCLRTGRRSEAENVADDVQAAAGVIDTASARGAALRCRGLAAGDADLLLKAMQAYAESPRRLEAAAAEEDAGTTLAAAGRADEAVACLSNALAAYEARGARRPADRVLAALRELGVRPGKRGKRSRAATGWESLTDRERRSATLAAEGLTNPQIAERLFVSPRTVETHLSNTYAKLSITSRVELAAYVAGRP
ncbi:MAG: LuxR C-terminal-related transcriptional regulator [Actinomycetota bacterium]|nr:LuxR C-terminal-related transcriptional regulator [Actinomycetota bacterium]